MVGTERGGGVAARARRKGRVQEYYGDGGRFDDELGDVDEGIEEGDDGVVEHGVGGGDGGTNPALLAVASNVLDAS